ncbi:uncharacterized protein ARMOST_04251 [Armillaria ostoyae]|uniref:Uncharacterized protein n=1 Tax=Armillaria ostoyae TaxID=47428 RepID=A0A284QWU4_ARMOS|nr:uncharacterized protein ARMOST_04251 [Armillaria ostoyae]
MSMSVLRYPGRALTDAFDGAKEKLECCLEELRSEKGSCGMSEALVAQSGCAESCQDVLFILVSDFAPNDVNKHQASMEENYAQQEEVCFLPAYTQILQICATPFNEHRILDLTSGNRFTDIDIWLATSWYSPQSSALVTASRSTMDWN